MVWRVKSLPNDQDRQFHKGYTLRRLMVVGIPQVLELAYTAERLVNSPAPPEGSPIVEIVCIVRHMKYFDCVWLNQLLCELPSVLRFWLWLGIHGPHRIGHLTLRTRGFYCRSRQVSDAAKGI